MNPTRGRYRVGDRYVDATVQRQKPVTNPRGHGAQINEQAWVQSLLAKSRARIEAGCTEPGNAPAGAPYPHQPERT